MIQITKENVDDNTNEQNFYLVVLGSEGNDHSEMWIRAIDGTYEKWEEIHHNKNWTAIPMFNPSDYVQARYETLEECIYSYLNMNYVRVFMFDNHKEFFGYLAEKN